MRKEFLCRREVVRHPYSKTTSQHKAAIEILYNLHCLLCIDEILVDEYLLYL